MCDEKRGVQRIVLKGHFGFGMLRSFAQKMLQAVIEESYHFLIRGMGCGQHRQGCDVMCVGVCVQSLKCPSQQ